MKGIQFQAVIPPQDSTSPVEQFQLYSVLLGNRVRCYFTSTRHAEQFNAAAERFLNDTLFRANMLLADTYPGWRLAWYYMDRMPDSTDRAVAVAMRDAEAAMDRALKRRGGEDYIHYAWKDVTVALAGVREVLMVLVELYRAKGHGVDRARYDVLLCQCNDLAERLRHWGSTEADAPNAKVIQRNG